MLKQTIHTRFEMQAAGNVQKHTWSLVPLCHSYAPESRMVPTGFDNNTIYKRPGQGLTGR